MSWLGSLKSPESWVDLCTLIGLPLSAIALLVGAWQLWLARKSTSLQTLVSLHESFRQAWLLVQASSGPARDHAVHDVWNLIEMACAAFNEGLMGGRAASLLREFIIHQLILFEGQEAFRSIMLAAQQTPDTFSEIVLFSKRNQKELAQRRLQLASPASR